MENYLIVGGGVSGMFLAGYLNSKGIPFVGLEKSRQLGQEMNFGQLRLYQDNSVGLLKEFCESVDWVKSDDQTKERKKGEWVVPQSDFIDEEKAFLGFPFYSPSDSFENIIKKIGNSIEGKFLTNKEVEKIDLDRKMVTCTDSSEYAFDRLAWCADFKSLQKVVSIPSKLNLKRPKKAEECQGGVHLEMVVQQPIFPFNNTVVFPFRYKDYKLRALGMNGESISSQEVSNHKIHWIVFLERELAEDREEVAKIIRALKRELNKEFGDLKTSIIKEKIIFQPKLTSYSPIEAKGLEVYPEIYYVGPELKLADSLVSNSPLDLTLENCKRFQEAL